MSKKCCNPKIGTLIHAYELGQLTDVETHLFEDHLLECEFCLDEVSSFQNICQTVLTDNEVHQALNDMVPEKPQSESVWSRIWRYLWPETNWLLKPVVAYAAVALLVYPAYLGFRNAPSDDAAELKTKELNEWFDRELQRLAREYHGKDEGYRLTPLGIYKTRRGANDTARGAIVTRSGSWAQQDTASYSGETRIYGLEEHSASQCGFCGKVIDGEYIDFSGDSYHVLCGETLATRGVELAEQYFQGRTKPQIRPVQALVLTSALRRGTRTLSSGTDLVIQFRIRGAEIGKSYTVTLEHEEAGIVFEDTSFTDIDRYDFSSRLYVPAELVKSGKYVLNVQGPGLGAGQSHPFEIDQ